MNRRTFIRDSSIVFTLAITAGCLENDSTTALEEDAVAVAVETPDTITPREVAEVTATITNDADEQFSGTVGLEVERVDPDVDPDAFPDRDFEAGDPDRFGLVLEYPDDPFQRDVTVDAGDSEDVVFEVPAAYKNLELGGLTLEENTLEVAVDAGGETRSDEAEFTVEDAAVEWFQPDGDKWCPVCNMATEQYEAWHAMVTHADGSRPEFCSTGCAVQYWVNPGWYIDYNEDDSTYRGMHPGTDPDDLVTMWAPDFTDVSGAQLDQHPGYEAFIDMRDGYFVLDDDTVSKFSTPMGGGSPVCFADYDDALAYVDGDLENLPDDVDMDNVSEDDIVELEGLTQANVAVYDGMGRFSWRD
ncbi:nitrous oxide reductase accessory protein NosL [Natronolimnohabitans sp. A-GB9]|uniref:nitrous oxide reductase accessory protein NosL n=1 Tax=Natronolimnohabitans sp. A-GB9 TaxID=3069757 RepID=UPI0027B50398|nr:nitrous oxide reductase accessory protein NosL [Natronolimnohabitans sp. A-GB9]MDQ2050070.1 nitrous oxide reductase accessory protein NosL [Natronolimnohabitans sp. A-GB9]